MPSVATQTPSDNPFVATPAPTFPPGSVFTVWVEDESYGYGAWERQFPTVAYPVGLTTAHLAALTAEKFAAAEAYRDRYWASCFVQIDVAHPALVGTFPPTEDGAREMWDRLREIGVVPFDVAA